MKALQIQHPLPSYPTPSPPVPPGGWPRITVVVPSYNQGGFLAATLDSILAQDYPNLECIVVDGGSADGSREIIEARADKLAWWCSEKDKGHADALNKGFARATGEILCWLNSDDLMAPWCLHTVGDVFARLPDLEWLTGAYGIWDAHGRLVSTYPSGTTATGYLRHDSVHVQQESTFWRRGLWEKAGARIDDSYRLMIDTELWLRFFRHAQLHSLATVVSGYRKHGENRAFAHPELLRDERWRAISTHLAGLSWRTRAIHAMGPDQYAPPRGLAGRLWNLLAKRFRRLLLPKEKAPRISWNEARKTWSVALRRVPQ